MCEGQIDLVGTINIPMSKLFQRCTASVSQYRSSTCLLMLAILQFYLDFGEYVLHDTDPSLNIFLKSCLSRLYADRTVASATLDFLNHNRRKLLILHPTLLPQYFPLLLKIIAWHGSVMAEAFLQIFPALMGPSSFLPLFPALLDLPTLVLALEDLERRSGSLLSENVSIVQKSPAPEALLALMDEAYTGSSTPDQDADSGDEVSASKDEADALFAHLLRDENDGLVERHWTFSGMAAAVEAVMGPTQSERLKQSIDLMPKFLRLYFGVAIRDVNDSLLCALLPTLFFRIDAMFPDKQFSSEAQKACLEFMLAAFQRSPQLISIVKKPIIDKIGQPYTSSAKAELALQLCWAIGEYGGGGSSQKAAARELFECLELLLYENLSSRGARRMGDIPRVLSDGNLLERASRARLLCAVVTAITKLATCHKEFGPRAHVCLTKVARSHQVLDKVVWRHARDYLGLMHEPVICSSILGPSNEIDDRPGTIRWADADSKAVTHIPFYLLQGKEGPPFHDFSLSDLFGHA
ncbi:hypothetical protein KP509_35G065900 [Ceratopteris richardii]|nr:hypothetical protein KP509_35G065900 [Ceratopteris richardii]